MTRSLLAALALAASALAAPKVDLHGDPLPDGAVVRFGTIRDRIGSTRVLRSFALSPDGKTLAAETPEGITLWDVDTGKAARRLPWRTWQGDNPRFDLCFSPDGKQLARLAGRAVLVLDARTGKDLFEHDLKEHGNGRGLAFVPGSNHILVTAEGKPQAFVFDISTRKVVRTVAFDGDYKDLVPAGRYVMARAGTDQVLLDRETGQVRARFRPSERWPTSVWAMTPDGRRVLLAGEDGRLRVFEAETGKKLEDLAPPPGWDRLIDTPRLAVAPDGATAYLAARHGKVFRRDLKAGKWLDPVPTGPEGELIPHPDGKRLLVLGGDGVLRRYDLQSLRPLPGPEGFEYELSAYPSPDGRRVAIESGEGRQNGRLDLFDIAGRPVWSVRPGATRGPGWWSPDGRWLACVASHQVTVREAATGKVARVVPAPGEDARFFQRAYFPPGADRLVAPVRFGIQLVTVDLATDAPPKLIPLGARSVRDLAPDGRTFVCLPAGGGLWLFDVNTRQYTARRPDPDGERRAADVNPRFSPDGTYLLTWELEQARAPTWAAKTFTVLRDPVTLATKREFEAEEASTLAFSPDGLWLALGRHNGDWSLWDIPTGERVGVWEGHRDSITSIGFAGPGRVLTGSSDLTALLWDLRPKANPKKPLWEALSGDDGRDAYRATWALAADPTAPEVLRTKVSPPPPIPADNVKQWLADLAADRFAAREAATKALQDLGRLAQPDLRAARDKATTEEVRTRLDAVLAKIPRERTGPEVIQARTVQALELAGTDAAKKLLGEWAAGPAGTRLTQDAKAALGRLAAVRP